MKKIRIRSIIDITIDDEEKKIYRIPECSIKRAAGSDFDLDKKDTFIRTTLNKVIQLIYNLKNVL